MLGVPWGASRAETLKLIVKRWQHYGGPENMRDVFTGDGFKPACHEQMCIMPATYIGPVQVLARWWFRDGTFTWSDLNFDPKQYQDLRQILVDRYGSPTTTTREKLKTKAAVEVENEKLSWSGQKVFILLEKYCCDSITGGKATLMLQSEVAKGADARRRQMEKGKKDL